MKNSLAFLFTGNSIYNDNNGNVYYNDNNGNCKCNDGADRPCKAGYSD